MKQMDQLPPSVLLHIFKFLPIPFLLKTVNRVCKLFWSIINENSTLWRHFEFEDALELNMCTLKSIVKKRVTTFRSFCIPHSITNIAAPATDLILSNLIKAKYLVWLDLSASQLSTLCFLQGLPKLEVLILDTCANIADCDIQAVTNCKRLEHLYIGYTSVSAEAVIEILPNRLHTLECSGVEFTWHTARSLLERHHQQLLFVTISLVPNPTYQELAAFKEQFSDTSILNVSL